ncbi:hypothetical protein VB636_02855, partial [Paracoccus sp. APAP_BH8]|uniref:hypothetical protein n=1 Tax=Paracoccus sp. APAP_BH8 TaxID=3110237 RepID=UPI002FD7C734
AERRDAIVAACEEIRAGRLHDQFAVDQIQGWTCGSARRGFSNTARARAPIFRPFAVNHVAH